MNHDASSSPWREVLLTACAPIIWGSTYIVTSEFLPPDRPFTAALIRALPAGVLLLLFTRQLPQQRFWWRLLILSALNIGVFQALLFVAAYRLPGGLAAVLGAIQPLLVMLWVWTVDRRTPGGAALVCAIAGVFGMAMLLLSPQSALEPIGVMAALLGAASMATGIWLTRRWQIGMPLLSMTGWQLMLGGLMLSPFALMVDAPLPTLTFVHWSAYAYLSGAGALVAYVLWFRGVARLPSVAVASLGLLSPLTAVVLGWAFLGQFMKGVSLVGLLVVLASVFGVQWASSRKP